jgi:hypothetical protein
MKRLALISALLLAGCGYDGSYRYPCQNPTNWDTPDCQPPICEASGTCTKDLIPPEALTP